MGQTASTPASVTATSRSSSPPFVHPEGGRAKEMVASEASAQHQHMLVSGDDDEEEEDDDDYNSDDCETDSYEDEDDYEDDDGYDTDDESNDYVESEDVETTDDGGGGTSQQNRRSSQDTTMSTNDISQMALVLAALEDHTLSELILTAPLSESRIRAATTKIKESDQQQQRQDQDSHVGDDNSGGKGKRYSAPDSSTSSGSLSGSSVTESTLYYSSSRAQYLKKHQSSSTSNNRSNNSSGGAGKSRVCGVGGGASSDRRSSAPDAGASAGDSTVGHTTDDDEDRTVGLCFRILRLSPTMAKMRFKLVPTKCPEHIFWLALWSILFETYQQEQEQQTPTKNKTKTAPSSSRSRSRKKKNDVQGDDASLTLITPPRLDESNNGAGITSSNSPDHVIFKLRRENERLGWTINDLRVEIDNLKTQLNEQEQKQKQTPSPRPTVTDNKQVDKLASSQSSLGHHSGTWMIDQDSKDFLSYPPELKQNLRQEKRKRLEEIRKQMKFILDSDNIEDTNGSWSCCGQTSYHGVCK